MSKKCPGKKLKIYSIFNDLTWPHPLTHPSTHQTIHTPIGGGVSTDFKSSNTIEISRLVQILLNFYWFWGPPSGGWGWVEWPCGGVGMMWGWWGQCGNDWDDVGTTWGQCGDHEITKNAITFEWIKIFQFYLKIWDPWTLLHTYRLDLICRWWCPFEIAAEIKTKCKIWLKCQFSHRTINHIKICNVPLDALMCPLQIINWHWTPIIDHSWCKCTLYPPPIQCRKLLNWP